MDTVALSAVIGSAAALITTLCWLPQAFKIVRERNASSISAPAYGALAFGVALWLVYGLMIGEVPVIAANAVTLLLVLVILGLKVRLG
ncbi:SemiSWEET transporter [Methylobrevis albus]|uniref:SemiSWEET transporter n=1 Tax=Methylobrevis albus TaxID=2793297 RepID=A0A931N067_9HYPH|nr:SemiSWEET transporter [Methylobrevis albus]MBH0238466.1 SemiSWEET transporter [Methylobrevis albus]